MDHYKTTVETYDRSAEAFSTFFRGIGSRVADIELALSMVGSPSTARVVEIGCGDGRDAAEIVPRVGRYQGFDPSGQLLSLARERNPTTSFVRADALSYHYPEDVDVTFAFASLLHVDRDDMHTVFQRLRRATKIGGVVMLSLKETDEYRQHLQTDQFGKRMFYYYTPDDITEAAAPSFTPVHESHQTIGSTNWFTMVLRKV